MVKCILLKYSIIEETEYKKLKVREGKAKKYKKLIKYQKYIDTIITNNIIVKDKDYIDEKTAKTIKKDLHKRNL